MLSSRRAFVALCMVPASFAIASPQPSNSLVVPAPRNDLKLMNLDNKHGLERIPDALRQSLATIQNVERMPSCYKIAASALLHSCSTLEGSVGDESNNTHSSDLFVQAECDAYGARLAVCELTGAEIFIPSACQAFIPTERSSKTSGFSGFLRRNRATKPINRFEHYDDITEATLQQCRQALGGLPQTWTSYSNNRQNAVVMCRAMRSEIEKDEQLHVAKILAETAAATSGSLKDAYEESIKMKGQFHDVAAGIRVFQREVATEHEDALERAERFWADWDLAQKRMHGWVDDVEDRLKDVAGHVDASTNGIKNNKERTDELVHEFTSAITIGIQQYKKDIAVVSSEASDVASAMQFMEAQMQAGLTQAVGKLITELQDSHQVAYGLTEMLQTFDLQVGSLTGEELPKVLNMVRQLGQQQAQLHADAALREREQQAVANHTLSTIQSVSQKLEVFGLAGMLLPNFRTFATSVLSFTVGGLFAFATFNHISGFGLVSNLAASIASGIVISVFASSISAPDYTAALDSLHDPATLQIMATAVALTGCLLGMVFAVRHIRKNKRHRVEPLYDPASPSFSLP